MTTVVNIRKHKCDVFIGRGSKWGNPFTHIADRPTKAEFVVSTRAEAISSYRAWIRTQDDLMASLGELKDKRLGCYCKPKTCHGDVLVELLNERKIHSIF